MIQWSTWTPVKCSKNQSELLRYDGHSDSFMEQTIHQETLKGIKVQLLTIISFFFFILIK